MIKINQIHHIALITSNLEAAKYFYTEILGFQIDKEVYRPEKQSVKIDLSLHGKYVIELFTFPSAPKRLSKPEACGLRHIAFEVDNIDETHAYFLDKKIKTEPIRIDEWTNKRFFFVEDPDHLPIEFYER